MRIELFGDWSEYDVREVPTDCDAVVGIYAAESYEGVAEVFRFVGKGKDIFQHSASHCSCNGLERLKEGNKVTPEYLRKILDEDAGVILPYGRRDDLFLSALRRAIDEFHPLKKF